MFFRASLQRWEHQQQMKHKLNKLGVAATAGIAGACQASAQITNTLSTGFTSLDNGGAALTTAGNWGIGVSVVVMTVGIGIGWLAALRRRKV